MLKVTWLFFLLIYTFNCYCQSVTDYKIVAVKPTIITNPPHTLDLTDTLDPERSFSEPEVILGGLKPEYPIARSYEKPPSGACVKCLRQFHTLSSHCINYIVLKDSSLVEINSKEKFKEIYAPVEDEEEALGFAYVLCDLFHPKAIYDFGFLKCKECDYHVYKKEIYPTNVKKVEGGYEVLLYSTYWGSTSYSSECIYFVTLAGDVSLISRTYVFEDKNYNLIID